LDCTLAFIHLLEVQLQASLEGKGATDLNVNEFPGMMDKQRKKAIAEREANDRKIES